MTTLESSLTGDVIRLCHAGVVKSGPHQYLHDQAKIMQAIGGKHVPEIRNMVAIHRLHEEPKHVYSYMMEQLEEVPHTPILWWGILEILNNIAWCRKESELVRWPQYNYPALREFLEDTNSALTCHADLMCNEITIYALADEMTHGDCTFENCMRRGDSTLVLIDWQPYRRPFVPPHRVVDYAKVFQSLLGTRKFMPGNDDSLDAVARLHPHVWFWAGIHFERIWKRAVAADDLKLAWHCKQQVRRCIQWKGKFDAQ